jgi:two-component system, OmpR family, response regulator
MDILGKRILIVDDDPDLCMMLNKYLTTRKAESSYALSGEECLRRVSQEKPDLIILDIMMPGIDGYEVCRRLKMQRETNPIPILMLSAKDTDQDRVVGLQTGADAYVSKPFEVDTLLASINGVIEKSAHMRGEHGFQGQISFRFQSHFKYLEEVNELIGQLFQRTDLAANEIWELKLALHELGINAIEHGNKMDEQKAVHITYTLFDDRLQFEIQDEGEGFEPQSIPNPTQREGLVRERGRGIYLVSQVVDQIEYFEGGTRTRLSKFFKKRNPDNGNRA